MVGMRRNSIFPMVSRASELWHVSLSCSGNTFQHDHWCSGCPCCLSLLSCVENHGNGLFSERVVSEKLSFPVATKKTFATRTEWRFLRMHQIARSSLSICLEILAHGWVLQLGISFLSTVAQHLVYMISLLRKIMGHLYKLLSGVSPSCFTS